MTNFLGTLWHSGDKLLCCWPQSPPSELVLCPAVVGSFSAWSCDSQWQRYQPDVLLQTQAAREAQEWPSGILAPVPDSTADSCCLLCLSVPLCSMLDEDVTSWLTNVLFLWETPALLLCNQFSCWSQADASPRYRGAAGCIWGTFSLKWKDHLGHVLEEEVFGCLWWVL